MVFEHFSGIAVTPTLCMENEDPACGSIISTMIFVTGIVTFIQCTWGCRLPLVQGVTISFLVPTLAISSLPECKCLNLDEMAKMNDLEKMELWQVRMREFSGAMAVSACFQVVIRHTGLVGKLLKVITPLTIVPTVSLVGLTLFQHASETAPTHWAMVNVNFPYVVYRKGEGLQIRSFELFKLFPVLLTIIIMWGICVILTVTVTLPEGHRARTEIRIRVLRDVPWFYIPYPGQFGLPTVTVAGVLLTGVLACTVESIRYYPVMAQLCNAPHHHYMPSTEGLRTVVAGLWGSGNGTNTFGENVGAIGVTKIGSRRVIQWASLIMIIQGVISKFGAVFIMIPVVGGIFCVMFGMITAFGLSALQYVGLRSSRNLYIVGVSIFFPFVLCQWMNKHPGAINTGIKELDGTLSVLLGTTILVGGCLGFRLDNLIPGSRRERGLDA